MNLAEPSPVVPGVRPTGVPGWIHTRPRHADSFRDFYSQLFGWEWEAVAGSAPGEHRFVALSHRRPVASVSTDPQVADISDDGIKGTSTRWSICFISSDVRRTASSILAAGGSTTCRDSVARNSEDLAVVEACDANGGAFMVLSEASIPDNPAGAGPAAVTWSELLTENVSRSADFYQSVFGLGDADLDSDTGVNAAQPTAKLEYCTLTKNDQSWAGVVPASQRLHHSALHSCSRSAPRCAAQSISQLTPQWLPWFGTTEVRASVQRAECLGARAVMAPRELMPGLRLSVLAGAEGELFALHEEDFGPGPNATAATIEH